MIAAENDFDQSNCRFIIRPNCSLTWRGTMLFYGGVSVVAMTIAIMFALKGIWLILPFAGIELIALGACLYITSCKASECEVVHIQQDIVRVERGRFRPHHQVEFLRAWARVDLKTHQQAWYPSRLTIRSMGKEVEIGARLNEEERLQLARELRQRLTF